MFDCDWSVIDTCLLAIGRWLTGDSIDQSAPFNLKFGVWGDARPWHGTRRPGRGQSVVRAHPPNTCRPLISHRLGSQVSCTGAHRQTCRGLNTVYRTGQISCTRAHRQICRSSTPSKSQVLCTRAHRQTCRGLDDLSKARRRSEARRVMSSRVGGEGPVTCRAPAGLPVCPGTQNLTTASVYLI